MCTIEGSSCIAESAGNFIDNAKRALLEIVGVLENRHSHGLMAGFYKPGKSSGSVPGRLVKCQSFSVSYSNKEFRAWAKVTNPKGHR
jgi:hypothetical protein